MISVSVGVISELLGIMFETMDVQRNIPANSQISLQLGLSEVRLQGIQEALGIVLNEIRELQNLSFAVGDGLELSALEDCLQGGANLLFVNERQGPLVQCIWSPFRSHQWA